MKRRRKGRINKGKPRQNYVTFPKELARVPGYTLRAQGDSMAPTIKDGDILCIEPGDRWKDKSIVIARFGNQPTCKRLRIHGDKKFLVPDNPDYTVVEAGSGAEILGKVVGLYRQFNDADD